MVSQTVCQVNVLRSNIFIQIFKFNKQCTLKQIVYSQTNIVRSNKKCKVKQKLYIPKRPACPEDLSLNKTMSSLVKQRLSE